MYTSHIYIHINKSELNNCNSRTTATCRMKHSGTHPNPANFLHGLTEPTFPLCQAPTRTSTTSPLFSCFELLCEKWYLSAASSFYGMAIPKLEFSEPAPYTTNWIEACPKFWDSKTQRALLGYAPLYPLCQAPLACNFYWMAYDMSNMLIGQVARITTIQSAWWCPLGGCWAFGVGH